MPTLYQPAVPPTTKFRNRDLNALASQYSTLYGHQSTALIERIVRDTIYDSSPQQYMDLKLLNMKTPETVRSDEFNYHEIGWGRDPIVTTNVGAVAAGATQAGVPIANVDHVSEDMIVVYPDNTKGIITAVNAGPTIDIAALTGGTLPQIQAGGDTLANLSPVEADGMNDISQYFRQETTEKYNFVQMLVKAMRFGKMELYKYKNAGTTNYLTMQRQSFMRQFRTDLSNIYWNGKKGEVTLANGMKAKTAGGVFTTMQEAGSPNATTTLANVRGAIEELALDTEYKTYGYTRFLYATPRMIHYISEEYKHNLTRYEPNDMVAKLNLKGIDIGSTMIVFVPMKRFEELSCFPASFRSRAILLDQESITPVKAFGEEMGETLPRVNGGTRENFQDTWVSATFSIEFNNPLGCGWVDVTDLP